MIIPEWFFKEEQAHNKNIIEKVYNPKTLKQKTRENCEINARKLDKELAKKMINPYYFTKENLIKSLQNYSRKS